MIRPLIESDIQGLNNLPPLDWMFDYESFIRGFMKEDFFHAFVMIQDDKIIGTSNVLIKNEVAWLANIIINEKYRGNGLGYKITSHIVEFSKKLGCKTQLLIATKLGTSVYRKIGFESLTDYECFDSEKDTHINPSTAICALNKIHLNSIYLLDNKINGEDRRYLIDRSYMTGKGYFSDKNELLGIYLPDFGRGLILSLDKQAGKELLMLKHSKKARRSMLPIENKDGITFLEQLGLKRGEKLSKMVYGKRNKWYPEYIYSYGSGYCG